MENGSFETLLYLLRCSFNDEKPNLPQSTDWRDLFSVASRQAVYTMLGDSFNLWPMNDENMLFWRKKIYSRLRHFYDYTENQDNLVKLLKSKNINFAIIKGFSAACLYARPEYRMMGDIDLLIKEEQYPLALKTVEENGYIKEFESDKHTAFFKNGYTIELHKNFGRSNYEDGIAPLQTFFAEGLKETVEYTFNGVSFPIMQPLYNGMVLLYHLKHHLCKGLGLRHLIDFYYFVLNNPSDEFWEKSFLPFCEKFGLKKLCLTLVNIYKMHFALPQNIVPQSNAADEKICNELIEYCKSTGNMGDAQEVKTKGDSLVWRTGGIKNAIENLHRDGRLKWRAAQKHRILIPFCSIYMICHYIKCAFKYRIGICKILRGNRALSKINQIITELDIKY